MNVRRLLLDVDKAVSRPDLITLAEAINGVPGVEGANITVTEIDIETVGMDITVEGNEWTTPRSSRRSRTPVPLCTASTKS